jgi:hypothetical protein
LMKTSESSAAWSESSHSICSGGKMSERETYLGDGLYASFDGWQVRLRAPRENGDHEVFLERSTLQAFIQFLDALPKNER